jgi:LL-diaminopimelate aminotransferase
VATLTRCGFQCQMPGGTYFLYTPSPRAFANGAAGGGPVNFENTEGASQYLITEQSICTVPWDDVGAFLRFSVTYEAADEKSEDVLMAETESRLKNIQPVF